MPELEVGGPVEHGVEQAHAAEQDAVARSLVTHAKAALGGFDGAVPSRDGIVREHEIVVGRRSDANGLAGRIDDLARVGSLHDLNAGFRVPNQGGLGASPCELVSHVRFAVRVVNEADLA